MDLSPEQRAFFDELTCLAGLNYDELIDDATTLTEALTDQHDRSVAVVKLVDSLDEMAARGALAVALLRASGT